MFVKRHKGLTYVLTVLTLILFITPAFGADWRIQYTERMVGANHPTLPDTLNRTNVYIDVMEYGAKGDGSTDDTVALQVAINYAKAQGMSATQGGYGVQVYLPAGIYLISDTLKLYGGGAGYTHLMGAGSYSTTIKLKDASNKDMIDLETVFTPAQEGHHHSTIEKLHLDGNKANQTTTTLKGIYAMLYVKESGTGNTGWVAK